MLRQSLVGGGVSVVNIGIHALVMTIVVWVAQSREQAEWITPFAVFDSSHDPDRLSSDGVFDGRGCAGGYRSRIFCIRQLHGTGLRRRNSAGAGGCLARYEKIGGLDRAMTLDGLLDVVAR